MNPSPSAAPAPLRLTRLSHSGGCGCKIAPGALAQILKGSAGGLIPPEPMVGIETADDAAVYRLNDTQARVATTDFFMPIAGEHTIDSVEPIYGLVVLGLVHPDRVRRNSGACPGDMLILGKPLGVGVLSAALKKGRLDGAGHARLVGTTTQLDTPGIALAAMDGVHALTDVTGFGLAGHALELARGAGVAVAIDWAAVPVLPGVEALAAEGLVTGASARNWQGYGEQVALAPALPATARDLLSNPQTSGGLLVTCAPGVADRVLQVFRDAGFAQAAVIGRIEAGAPGLRVAP
jgi:selenide,water dikinase